MSDVLTESKLIEMMRTEYKRRLVETIQEAEMFDKSGNMVIRKGLKVRHQDTQYEYTVDDVVQGPDGDLTVHLKLPDEPRISPQPGEEVLAGGAEKSVIQELDPPAAPEASPTSPSEVSDEDDELFVIDQEEFEKEYEVK